MNACCNEASEESEGVALGAGDQELLERCQARIIAQQGLQEFVGARWWQWVEPQLRVVRLAPQPCWYSGR